MQIIQPVNPFENILTTGSACTDCVPETVMPIILPNAYTITDSIAGSLRRIDRERSSFSLLPVTSALLHFLREKARPVPVYLSQMKDTTAPLPKFKKRERDNKARSAYFNAMDFMETLACSGTPFREHHIQMFHALVQGGNPDRSPLTPWRTRQNSIVHSLTGESVYTPPVAQDVPELMTNLFDWLQIAVAELPIPLAAGMLHYQLVTIHPFYDGNGRSARLAATLLMRRHGYGLRGAYSFEEHYAHDLDAYYDAHEIHPHHDYYIGRGIADVTEWLDYFCSSVATHFEGVSGAAALEAKKGKRDESDMLRALDTRQRAVLGLFLDRPVVTASELGIVLGLTSRKGRQICRAWLASGFLVLHSPVQEDAPHARPGWLGQCRGWLQLFFVFFADPLSRKRQYCLAGSHNNNL